MFMRIVRVCLLSLFCLVNLLAAHAQDGVIILCYHDVGNASNDFTISKEKLIAEFEYLKNSGYHPISVKQYLEANKNQAALPEKPVLLSFDDGYISFYQDVYPLLKQYQYPAMFAVVTHWENAGKPSEVGTLVNWQQLRELEQSGLVTIASHSHNMHHGISVNSYGDVSESASSFHYVDGRYESLEEYTKRITRDLEETQTAFEQGLGHRAEALVWPYGEYTEYSVDIAKKQGFTACFGLYGKYNIIGDEKSLFEARRGLIYKSPTVQKFAKFVQSGGSDDLPLRAAWVNIDSIFDAANTQQTNVNVHELISRYRRLGINTVFLPAYKQGEAGNEGVYFHTNAAPVKALAFDHIARIFRMEGIFVYAVMPPFNLQQATAGTKEQQAALELYKDLSQYSFLDGVVFQDEIPKALSPAPTTDGAVNSLSNHAVTELTIDLMKIVHQFKPYAKFIRSVYPAKLQDAQAVSQYLAAYDYTFVRPYALNGIKELSDIAAAVMKQPGAREKVIFEVSTYDSKEKHWILDKKLKDYIQTCSSKGAVLFGFYPDALFSEKSALFLN
jgi:biofilm PGA synthesis lipoprotein PgaB